MAYLTVQVNGKNLGKKMGIGVSDSIYVGDSNNSIVPRALQTAITKSLYDDTYNAYQLRQVLMTITFGGTTTNHTYSTTATSWTPLGTTRTFNDPWLTDRQIVVSDFFNSSNPTVASINATLKLSRLNYNFRKTSGGTSVSDSYEGTATIGSFQVKLNAPPTCSYSYHYDTVIPIVGSTTYTATISSLTAKYGGNITDVCLRIGSQEVHRTSTGNLSIKLNATGTFSPVIEITDSRGQVGTYTLPSITVVEYTKPTLTFDADRCDNRGIIQEEGAYALITAKFSYFDAGGNHLLEPNFYIDGEPSGDITWYENYGYVSGVSNPVDWNNYAPSTPVILYGLVTETFSTSKTYTLGIEPNDDYYTGALITKTLNTGYYTMDVGCAGKAIAFGGAANTPASQVPNNGLFRCDMDANFTGNLKKNGTDVSVVGHKHTHSDITDWLNYTHPVGSVICMGSNTNPGNTLGGTWTLIDKEFKTQEITNAFVRNTTNTTSIDSQSVILSGKSIWVRMGFTNKVALGDTAIEVAYLGTSESAAFNKIGLTSTPYLTRLCGWSDGGNAILQMNLFAGEDSGHYGRVTSVDAQPATCAKDSTVFFTASSRITDINKMLDSFCDKFYWKRTA